MRRLLILLALLVPAALCAPGTALAVSPSSAFDAPKNAYTDEPVTLTITSPEVDPLVVYTWAFGDVQPPATGPEVTTSYVTVGQYTVSVTATRDGLEPSTSTHVITVGRPVPSAVDFTVTNNEPVVGETIDVYAPDKLADYETDGLRCKWTADQPVAIVDPGACNTKMTWTGSGSTTKNVKLKVTDVKGQSVQANRSIKVLTTPGPPNQLPNAPSLSYSPTAPVAGQPVTFTSKATDPDGTIESYEWDFDSDRVYEASGETAGHVFTTAGNYTVTVRATDNNGGSKTSFQTIFVSSPPAGEVLGTSNSGSPPSASTPLSGQGQPRQPARLLSPFPIVRLRGSVVGRTSRINLLSIQGAPRGAKVRVRCRGGGCPRKLVTSTALSSRRAMRLRSFERRLVAGAKLEIYITQSGRLGKYTRFEIRRNAAPRRTDRCVRSFPGKPVACPAAD